MTHDEMIQVITAHKEGKQIQYRERNNSSAEWMDGVYTHFAFDCYEFRVKPAKPKKVKLEAWLGTNCGEIYWRVQNYDWGWMSVIRIPELDKEITLPEGVEL